MSTNNLIVTTPTTVLPKMLFTHFQESRTYPQLIISLHDGTQERRLIQDGVNPPDSIKSWSLGARLRGYLITGETISPLAALQTFYETQNGGLLPFWFYSPVEPETGHPIGSNWDATGSSDYGRYKVKFSSQTFSFVGGIGRHDVTFSLMEVA